MNYQNQYNILEEWKKDMEVITSPLAIKEAPLKRETVYFIYKVLVEFFGLKYFNIVNIININNPKIILNRNHFYQLLNDRGKNSILSLLDIATLLSFAKKLPNGIYRKLQTLRNDANSLRNHLFEVFIYRFFLLNNLEINIKPLRNSQELEGTLTVSGTTFLVECKKLYNTEFNRTKHLQHLFNLFFEMWVKEIHLGLFCFIIAPNDDKKSQSEDKVTIEKGIREYIDDLRKYQNINISFRKTNDRGQPILYIGKYNNVDFNYLHERTKSPFAFFSAAPPPVILKDKENLFNFHLGYKLGIPQEEIEHKVIEVIRKKRRQHRTSDSDINLFFFENESATSGEIPLITSNIMKSDLITNYLNSKDSNDMICIIDKKLFPNQIPQYKMHVFCREEFNDIKLFFESLDLRMFKF